MGRGEEKKGRVRGRDMEEEEREGGGKEREGGRVRERDSLDWHRGGKSWAGVHSCSARSGGSQQ